MMVLEGPPLQTCIQSSHGSHPEWVGAASPHIGDSGAYLSPLPPRRSIQGTGVRHYSELISFYLNKSVITEFY